MELIGDGYIITVQTDHGPINTYVIDTDDGRICDLGFEAVYDDIQALQKEIQAWVHASCRCIDCILT